MSEYLSKQQIKDLVDAYHESLKLGQSKFWDLKERQEAQKAAIMAILKVLSRDTALKSALKKEIDFIECAAPSDNYEYLNLIRDLQKVLD